MSTDDSMTADDIRKSRHIYATKKASNKKMFDVIDPLPDYCFLGVVVGGVRSGKSVLLSNLFKRYYTHGAKFESQFDQIIIVSPTIHMDQSLEPLRELDPIIIDTDLDKFDEALLPHIIESLTDNKEDNIKTLLILDDMLGMLGKNFNHICTRYRHYNLSIIVTSQNYRSISPIVRNNATFIILFSCPNQRELAKYIEEQSDTFKHFEYAYKDATSEPYQFLFVDVKNRHLYKGLNLKQYE